MYLGLWRNERNIYLYTKTDMVIFDKVIYFKIKICYNLYNVRGRGEHMQYYAHISDDKVRRQTVKEHLTGTPGVLNCSQRLSGAEHGGMDAEFCTTLENIPRDSESVWKVVPLQTMPRRGPRR